MGDRQGRPAGGIYTITGAGEAYLDFWAAALGQYRRNLDTFFQLYTGRPLLPEEEEEKGK